MSRRDNNYRFSRRLTVSWSAHSWRPRILAVTPVLPFCPTDEYPRQVCIFRQSSGALSHRTARPARRSEPTFLNLPRMRVHNPPPI